MSKKYHGRKPMYGETMKQRVLVGLPANAAEKLQELAQQSLASQAAIARKLILDGLEQMESEGGT